MTKTHQLLFDSFKENNKILIKLQEQINMIGVYSNYWINMVYIDEFKQFLFDLFTEKYTQRFISYSSQVILITLDGNKLISTNFINYSLYELIGKLFRYSVFPNSEMLITNYKKSQSSEFAVSLEDWVFNKNTIKVFEIIGFKF